MARITWMKKLGLRVYLTFKLWRMVLISILVLSIILSPNLLVFLPSVMRWTFAFAFVLLVETMVFTVVRFITGSAGQVISAFFYNRKNKPKEHDLPSVKRIAKKMGMKYDKPIYTTDNPSIKSPFTNVFSGKITFPTSWMKKFHRTENEGVISHELAHIKHAPRFVGEMCLITISTMGFTMLLAAFRIIPSIYIFAELAFMMLLLSYTMRHNEFKADRESAMATTPEALISVFQYLKAECQRDDGSETHPSLKSRIKRLMHLLESDCEHQSNR